MHWQVHTGERPYERSKCGDLLLVVWYSFYTREYIKEKGLLGTLSAGNPLAINLSSLNTSIHREQRPYRCSQGGKSFTSSSTFGITRESMLEIGLTSAVTTGNVLSLATCSVIKEFTQEEGLNKYHECGKSFIRRRKLLYHLGDHTGERSYACTERGKFCRGNYLPEYWSVHTASRPYDIVNVRNLLPRARH